MMKPPYSNTGAHPTCAPSPSLDMGVLNTAPLENRSLIDWLSVTMPFDDPWYAVKMLGMKPGLFTELERGGMGYKKSLSFGHIRIFYDGSENMGVHICMSGQGCREYEAQGFDWPSLFCNVFMGKGHFTRLDLAIDTVDGSLSVNRLYLDVRRGNYRSTFSRATVIRSFDLTADGCKSKGATINLGSNTSRVKFRVYDKAAQMGAVTPWVRFELQLREERADKAAYAILGRKTDIGIIATEIINQYFSIITITETNKSRCKEKAWWSAWLKTTSKLKLTTAKAIKYIEEVKDYIKKQYAPTIAMLKKGLGVVQFSDFMKELLTDGYRRMSTKHDQIIQVSKLWLEPESDYPF